MENEFIIRECDTGKELARIGNSKEFIMLLQKADFVTRYRGVQHHKISGHFGPWLEANGETAFSKKLKPFEKMPVDEYVLAAGIIYDNIKRKSRGFQDVVGMEGVKELLNELVVFPERMPELAERYGKRQSGGILLYGPPGCGKTHTAKALAGETSRMFVRRSVTVLLKEGPEEIHSLFWVLKEMGGGIACLDDMELLAFDREDKHSCTAGTNVFLSVLDSVEDSQVLVIGSTNYPWRIDQAILRSGRLGSLAYVGVPVEKMRVKLFEFYTKGLPLGSIDFENLAGKCEFYSCSDIKAICEEAASVPWREALSGKEPRELGQKDFEQAIARIHSTSLAWFESALDIVCPDPLIGRFSDMFRDIERYREARKTGKRTACYG